MEQKSLEVKVSKKQNLKFYLSQLDLSVFIGI